VNWLRQTFLTWQGRLDRRGLIVAYFVGGTFAMILLFLATMIRLGVSSAFGVNAGEISLWDQITNIAFGIILYVPLSSFFTRRLHDLGFRALPIVVAASALAAFAHFFWSARWVQDSWMQPAILAASTVLISWILFWPGQRGENRFGSPRRKI
jgi:uncharacterized membrane protein YhaH (DUF805 family)